MPVDCFAAAPDEGNSLAAAVAQGEHDSPAPAGVEILPGWFSSLK